MATPKTTKKAPAKSRKSPAKTTSIVKAQDEVVVHQQQSNQILDLIQIAVNQPNGLDVIKELTALKNEQEDRFAKQQFGLHFSEMQSEFKPVKRLKQGNKAKYAPLEDLQKTFGPIISKHGFSYRWNEEAKPEGYLLCTLIISGWGHEVSNSKLLPPYVPDKGGQSGKSIMNSLQAEGVRSSYGRRYTFISGFGLIMEDEDSDGALPHDDDSIYGDMIREIDACNSVPKLNAVSKALYDKLGDDEYGVATLRNIYLRRKNQIAAKGSE